MTQLVLDLFPCRCSVLRRKEFIHQGSPRVSKVRTLLPGKRSSGVKFTFSREKAAPEFTSITAQTSTLPQGLGHLIQTFPRVWHHGIDKYVSRRSRTTDFSKRLASFSNLLLVDW
ncbi:hypothetical protein Bbelb_136660 [Branchiostoma belcheri]|nr:hypothetical protein Bbelb_136660 [Branchiostoma belcheri]